MKNKSATHAAVQEYLLRLYGRRAQIEKNFPQIGRIADCAIPETKLIFEIQCSPLSREEARSRIADYGSLGYTLIWILHDSLFNSLRVTDLEIFLERFPHYYTNISASCRGIIYDQYEKRRGRLRFFRSSPFPVDLRTPLTHPFEKSFPNQLIRFRKQQWAISFAGDLCHRPLPRTCGLFYSLMKLSIGFCSKNRS